MNCCSRRRLSRKMYRRKQYPKGSHYEQKHQPGACPVLPFHTLGRIYRSSNGAGIPRVREWKRQQGRLLLESIADDLRRRASGAAGRCDHRARGNLSRAGDAAPRRRVRRETNRLPGRSGREGRHQRIGGHSRLEAVRARGVEGDAAEFLLWQVQSLQGPDRGRLVHRQGKAAPHRRGLSQRQIAVRDPSAGAGAQSAAVRRSLDREGST